MIACLENSEEAETISLSNSTRSEPTQQLAIYDPNVASKG